MTPSYCFVLACLLLCLGPAVAAPESAGSATLRVEATRTTVAWGRALRVRVTMTDPKRNLGDLDLSAWREGFDVSVGDVEWADDPRWPDEQLQSLRLKLYPLRTGRFTLPALELSGAMAAPLTLVVEPARDQGRALQPAVTISHQNPWQRQQLVIRLTVLTAEPLASLGVDQPPAFPGFELLPLGSTREQRGERYELGIGWALFPLLAGDYRLRLPPVEYRISGGARYAWHLPAQQLTVRALPAYLPPTLPVGRIELGSELRPAGVLVPGELAWWRLELSGPLPGSWLPPLAGLNAPPGATALLAPELRSETELAKDGVTGRRVIEVPIKPLRSGRLRLPAIALSWFDPVQGRLQQLQLRPPRPWVIARYWLALAAALAAIALLALLVYGGRRLRRYLRWRRAHRQALAALDAAADARELRRALGAVAGAQGWPANLSLRDWAAAWGRCYRVPPDLPALLSRLAAACYGPGPQPHAGLQQGLLDALRVPMAAPSRRFGRRRRWLARWPAPSRGAARGAGATSTGNG